MREQLRRQMTNRASLDGTIPSCDEEEDDASMEQVWQGGGAGLRAPPGD